MKETELAKYVEDYFSGFDVYKEVNTWGKIVDLVTVSCGIRTAIEVKTSFSVDVIEQAYGNLPFYHYSYVAVPAGKSFASNICAMFGIGVLRIDKITGRIMETNQPKLNRKPASVRLYDFQKENIAGVQTGRETVFSNSIKNIHRYVKSNAGTPLSEVLRNTNWHWANISSARSCIYQWIQRGIITEFYIEDGKVYPAIHANPEKFVQVLNQINGQ